MFRFIKFYHYAKTRQAIFSDKISEIFISYGHGSLIDRISGISASDYSHNCSLYSNSSRGNAQATITVTNQGNSEAKNFKLEWKPLANAPGKIITVSSLKAGESKPFSFNSSYSNLGIFETVAIVDLNNNVAESNEANNSLAQQITVKPAKSRQAKVKVKFTNVRINDDADTGSPGEIKLDFNVNGKTWRWSNKNANTGRTYKLKKTFTVTLKEKEKLTIFIDGIDEDAPDFFAVNDHDQMGVVKREFTSSNEWGKGNHSDRSSCPDGCYTIDYTISVTWLN